MEKEGCQTTAAIIDGHIGKCASQILDDTPDGRSSLSREVGLNLRTRVNMSPSHWQDLVAGRSERLRLLGQGLSFFLGFSFFPFYFPFFLAFSFLGGAHTVVQYRRVDGPACPIISGGAAT